MNLYECTNTCNGAVLVVTASSKAQAERHAGYILGVGKRTWLLRVREVSYSMKEVKEVKA